MAEYSKEANEETTNYFGKSSLHLKERIRTTTLLVTGTFTYFANVVLFSRAVKQNNRLWILYLGMAAVGYFLTVRSNNTLQRTSLNVTPVFKCCQLLFRPTLIAITEFYLLSIQKHDEEWVWWLTLVAFAIDADYRANNGHYKVANRREPRWLLFKGFELLVGGFILCINGAVLLVCAINSSIRYKKLFFALGFITVFNFGLLDVAKSIICFERYSLLEEQVYDYIIDIIFGPIIFFSAFICFKLVKHLIMLPGFIIISGMGLALLGHSLLKLYLLLPPPVFMRYCRRVLGPVAIAYSTFVSAYIGYRMGWRFSVLLMPLIPFGIHFTYRGWRE